MSTSRIAVTFISVQDAKPSYSYKNPTYPPVEHLHSRILVRANLPTLPAGSVITSAEMWVNQTGTWAGSNTLILQRNFASWNNLATWNNKPALGDATHSQSKTGSTPGTWWNIDVTADVQGFYNKTKGNWGWSLYTTSATRRNVRGSSAPEYHPYLLITYIPPAKVPTDLSPQGGAVSVADPVLTFTTGDDTTAINVQIDPASDGVTPDFDSGTVAATGGVLDLSATAYAGLGDGDTTYWRARAQTAAGWSAWSPWVSFSREDMGAVTIISPDATPADTTPPVEWSFTGTQVAYQVLQVQAADGQVILDSGRIAGADTDWTPTANLDPYFPNGYNGWEGRTVVRIWDDKVRIATQGAPAYAEEVLDWTVTFDGAVEPLDTLTATQVLNVPMVVLAGTRAAGTPDEVVIFRNGIQVARMPGTDVFTGDDFEWVDWTAPMYTLAEYRVAPVVNGAVAADGPTVEITPRCVGVWLVNPETDASAVLWGVDEGSWARDDIAAVHQTVAGMAAPVRRRLARPPLSGSIAGDVFTVHGLGGLPTETALNSFAEDDAGVVYRLVAGHLNIPVVIGNVAVSPSPFEGDSRRRAKARFDWWGQG